MRGTKMYAWAIGALISVSGYADARPTVKHETSQTHFPTENIWTSASSWVGAPPPAQSADNTALTSGWTVNTPADIAANIMFDFTAMDGSMNVLSHYTHDHLTSYSIQITRSLPGTPQSMDFTIDSELYEGVGGLIIELAAPVTLQMQRTGFQAAGTPGLFLARYEGIADSRGFLITDPGIDGQTRLFESADPTTIEIFMLTDVPAPGVAAIGLAALPLVSRRRRTVTA